jgi:hypothetical protein
MQSEPLAKTHSSSLNYYTQECPCNNAPWNGFSDIFPNILHRGIARQTLQFKYPFLMHAACSLRKAGESINAAPHPHSSGLGKAVDA